MLFAFSNVKAQDMITLKTGDQIKCKVTEVGVSEIKYKKENTPDATVYVIDKSTVLVINYEDGSKDVINETTSILENKVKVEESSKGLYLGINVDPSVSYYYNSNNKEYGPIPIPIQSFINPNCISGISFGVYLSNTFGITTGFNFSRYASTYRYASTFNDPILDQIKIVADLKYLNVPISFSFITGQQENVGFYFDIGPQFGFLLSGTRKVIDPVYGNKNSKITDDYKSVQIFGNLSIGGHIPISSNRFSLDVGPFFNFGLLNSFKQEESSDGDYSTTSSTGIIIHFKTWRFFRQVHF